MSLYPSFAGHSPISITNSDLGHSYHMEAPFSCLQETVRYTEEPPSFQFISFSPTDCIHSTISKPDLLQYLKQRPLHRHDYFELMCVLDGEVKHCIEDQEYLFPTGSCCLLNCNTRHTERFSSDFRVFFLSLSREYTETLMKTVHQFVFAEEQAFKDSPVYQFLAADTQAPDSQMKYLEFQPVLHSHPQLLDIIEKLAHTILFPEFGATFAVQSLICSLFQYLSDPAHYHVSHVTVTAGAEYQLFSRISLLLQDADGRLSRKDLERLLNYNGAYLNKIVKKYTGMNLFQYGMSYCMKKACELLTKTDLSISDIALQLQFTNRTHFYKVFRGQFGVTPGEYRDSHSDGSFHITLN